MSLRDKLARLLPNSKKDMSPTERVVEPLPSGPALRERLNALQNLQTELARLTDEGDTLEFEHLRQWKTINKKEGTAWVARESLPTDTVHGQRSLRPNNSFTLEPLHQLVKDARLAPFRLKDALFIDIEATGLSHGAGTLAFVIGIGWYDSNDLFQLEQIVLKDPAAEYAQLQYLKTKLEEKSFLVSFNGKSYDMSVLQSRMVLHRLYTTNEMELKLTPHVDLLHLYRAIWGKTLPNCRLGTLENHVLNWERVGDIPGAIVPSLYFAYLQTSDARTLDPILLHNKWDILSMVSLLFRLQEDVQSPHSLKDPVRMVQLGRLFVKRGDLFRAKSLVSNLLALPVEGSVLLDSLKLGVEVYKKTREHHLLYPLLHTMTSKYPNNAYGWLERAKYEEHRLKDYSAALSSTRHAVAADPLLAEMESKRLTRLANRVHPSEMLVAANECSSSISSNPEQDRRIDMP